MMDKKQGEVIGGRVASVFKGWSEKVSLRKQYLSENLKQCSCLGEVQGTARWSVWPDWVAEGESDGGEIQSILRKADFGKGFAQRWEAIGGFYAEECYVYIKLIYMEKNDSGWIGLG